MNKFFDILAAQEIPKVLIMGLGLGIFYYFFFFNDGSVLNAQIESLNQQLSVEETKKKDTDNTLKQVQEMQEKIGQLSLKYQEISRRLPASLYSIDINKSIDDFARGSGVSVKSKKPGENVRGEIVEEVPVEVNIEGNYAQLSRFAFLVSNAERMSRVKNVVISAVPEDVKRLKFVGQVVGYKLTPEKATRSNDNRSGANSAQGSQQ
jgi:type IV pilus assembly protein PilO